MKRIEITMRSVHDIIPYERNARINDDAVAAVAESINQFGFKVPIVLDINDEIIAGHTRLKAALKLGYSEVPCVIADDLTDEEVKAFRLADNKVAEMAEWDADLLNIELESVASVFDMTSFGFLSDDDEIAREVSMVQCPRCKRWMPRDKARLHDGGIQW